MQPDNLYDDPEIDAQNVLRYFERLADETGSQQFVRGAEYAREWLALRDARVVSQDHFDGLLARIEDIDSPGSGYYELWLGVRHWGYSIGLVVSHTHPWGVDRRKIVCSSNDGFKAQLTIGKEYTILKVDDERSLVQIQNDQDRHRWYPRKGFQFTVRPDRDFFQKEN